MAIATGTAIAIAAAATAGTTAYQTHSAGKHNKRAMAATERSDERAARIEADRLTAEREAADRNAQIERERMAQDKASEDARLAETRADRETRERRDVQRWQDYLRINEPFWRQGAGVAGSLFDIAGFGQGNAPAFSMPEGGPPMAGGGAPAYPGDAPMPGGPRGPMTGGPIPDGIQTMSGRGARGRQMPTVATPAPSSMNLTDLMMLANSIGKGGGPQMPPPESLAALAGMGLR